MTSVPCLHISCNRRLDIECFLFQTWDDRGTTVLSAVTAGIRSSWMTAIKRAANLSDPDDPVDVSCQDGSIDAKPQSPTA